MVGSSAEKWKIRDDVAANVAQQERSNNKCNASTFRYIYIQINDVINIDPCLNIGLLSKKKKL